MSNRFQSVHALPTRQCCGVVGALNLFQTELTGIVAEREKFDVKAAFGALRGHAWNNNLRITDVATATVNGTLNSASLRPTSTSGTAQRKGRSGTNRASADGVAPHTGEQRSALGVELRHGVEPEALVEADVAWVR